MTSRLTFNFGIRWDYFGVQGEKDHLFYTLDATQPLNLRPTNQLYNKDLNNFAPRLAFAYDVTGKGRTVIRGGWGVFYDAFAQDIFIGHAPYNCAFCPGAAYTGTGPAPISSAGIAVDLLGNPLPLDPNAPVYGAPSTLS